MAHWSQVDLNATFDMEFMTIVLFSVHVVPPSIHAVLTLHFDQHSGADEQTWRAGEEGVLAQGFSWISKKDSLLPMSTMEQEGESDLALVTLRW